MPRRAPKPKAVPPRPMGERPQPVRRAAKSGPTAVYATERTDLWVAK